MTDVLLLAANLIVLHTLSGVPVQISPQHVTTLIPHASGRPNRVLVDQVQCVVNLVDGRFVSVKETCDDVRRLLAQ